VEGGGGSESGTERGGWERDARILQRRLRNLSGVHTLTDTLVQDVKMKPKIRPSKRQKRPAGTSIPELFEERSLADELPDLMLQDVVLAFDCVYAV
jgi:hypothetical protein